MYHIENNVSIPLSVEKRGQLPNAMRKMQIGDSIVVDKRKRTYSHVCAGYAGIKIKTANEGADMVRVWRIA